MWVKDTRLYEMEKGWKIIPISYKACEMEWVMVRDNEPLVLVPVKHRKNLYVPSPGVIFRILQKKTTSVDLSNSRRSRKWMESIDIEWLRVRRR